MPSMPNTNAEKSRLLREASLVRLAYSKLAKSDIEKREYLENQYDKIRRQLELLSTQEVASERAETKICPDCSEEIKFAARKCRFCGYRFDIADSSITTSYQHDFAPSVISSPPTNPSRHAKPLTVPCPHCGHLCSLRAPKCPSCGAVLRSKTFWNKDIGCGGAFYVLLILLGFATMPAGFVLIVIGGVALYFRTKRWNEVGS